VEQYSADSAGSLASIAAITANLKNSLQQSRLDSGTKPHALTGSGAEVVSGRVLVFFESEPAEADRQFLIKMMAAIHLQQGELVLEWGDFPEKKCPIVLGVGLSSKKSTRLESLRPDRFELPSLSAIQSDPQIKREAWETLKLLAGKLKDLS